MTFTFFIILGFTLVITMFYSLFKLSKIHKSSLTRDFPLHLAKQDLIITTSTRNTQQRKYKSNNHGNSLLYDWRALSDENGKSKENSKILDKLDELDLN